MCLCWHVSSYDQLFHEGRLTVEQATGDSAPRAACTVFKSATEPMVRFACARHRVHACMLSGRAASGRFTVLERYCEMALCAGARGEPRGERAHGTSLYGANQLDGS